MNVFDRVFFYYSSQLTPWNVDTLSKPGFEKTVINTYKKKDEELTEEERGEKMVGYKQEFCIYHI